MSFIDDEHEVKEILQKVTIYFMKISFDNLSYNAKELTEPLKQLQKEMQEI